MMTTFTNSLETISNKYNRIIIGIPRSGTTLLCRIINQNADCLALNEPMNLEDVQEYGSNRISEFLFDYFDRTRSNILTKGLIKSKGDKNEIANEIASHDKVRSFWRNLRHMSRLQNPKDWTLYSFSPRKIISHASEIELEKKLTPNFYIYIKQPVIFTALLQDIIPYFSVIAVVRNPLLVLESWNQIDFPLRFGYVPSAQHFDKTLDELLKNTETIIARQLIILNWFAEKILSLPPKSIIRYEDLVAGLQITKEHISHGSEMIRYFRSDKSRSASRKRKLIYDQLMNSEGPIFQLYSRNQITQEWQRFISG